MHEGLSRCHQLIIIKPQILNRCLWGFRLVSWQKSRSDETIYIWNISSSIIISSRDAGGSINTHASDYSKSLDSTELYEEESSECPHIVTTRNILTYPVLEYSFVSWYPLALQQLGSAHRWFEWINQCVPKRQIEMRSRQVSMYPRGREADINLLSLSFQTQRTPD